MSNGGDIVFEPTNPVVNEEVPTTQDISFSYPWPEIALSGVFGLLIGLLIASMDNVFCQMVRNGRLWLIALASVVLIALVALIINKFSILGEAYKEYYGAGVIILILGVITLIGVGVYKFSSNKGRRSYARETRPMGSVEF